ncbi:retrovirus-related Pol polyprotein from transposon 17.6 [Trichonephila clavipes]|nr:retrovirus-related Pol polyprotein from transposon 17.6 [Trichonephila clavipes]
MPNETHVQLASRLLTNWDQYCNLRNVNDFNSLKELIVSDKLYETLDNETAVHINIKQEQNWFKPIEMGKECDMFYACKGKSFSEFTHRACHNQNDSRKDIKYIPPNARREENEVFAESADSSITFSNDENEAECGKDIFYVESDSDNINFNSDYTKMKDEQNTCDSLKTVRKELKLNKGIFLLIDGLIYHRDKILNEPVMQLVLPRCRIDKVMKLAHESVFGGHMGVKKTKERIKYNFFWPNMSGEIAEFVQTCKGCQLRKPEKIGDRTPITPIVRPELPFEIVNIDVIGPTQPPSGRGHKYVLCMMDQHTRWPEAVPLRSLTAKNACDSLLQIFSRTGIPSIIASDQDTNFKSALTQEFTKRIGSSPRFSCPGYPASNGLVERWNKVLKDMIHHVIREDPRSWDRQLPFLLFAYREVPNTTTGVSPFRLLYGREARGPLAILKSSWAGEIHLPTNISQSAADYLQEMKINMEKAAESASLTAAQKQKAYGDYFNKRSSVKNFSIGEQVVLLIPDSSNKIYARWTGPGEIIQHHPPHSYKVKLPDGTVRHVHVNKIRKYHPRALAVGVIFEGDHEFGEIHPTPNLSRSTSERVLHEINLNHLKESEREQVLAIVLKHQTLFTSDVKIAKSLKIKVDEQIEELVRLDLIEESDAEIAYPIVCVNKKDGTLRLCVDFRALNSESVSDDFPMEDAVELIHSIGRANIITTLDLLKGYWAIPMAEDSKNLTSFKTHRQQYRFKVMSFGLKNASATFQREMNKALSCYREFSRAYIDDIAIFSKNWEEHLLHLDTILTKLSELNFTVNLKKCAFGKAQIKYLGHIIGSGKHEPDPEKTAVINNLPVPKTKKELRSVLGLCNYYLEAPSLYSPVPDKPYTIHSDASQIGIAACLSQKCGDKCYPIAYASQKLSKTQQSWSTIEREAFVIVWSLKKFEVWVFGTEIEFYTDHNPLPYLTKSAPQSARLQRWAFALQKFNVTIKHCPGVKCLMLMHSHD